MKAKFLTTKPITGWKPIRPLLGALTGLLFSTTAGYPQEPPQPDTTVIDADGTAHITRVVPIPAALSPEAKAVLRRQLSDAPVHQTLMERRRLMYMWQKNGGEASRKVYPVNDETCSIAGVPVRIFTPQDAQPQHPQSVLINLHGGGFNSDSGSLTETIPVCNLTRTRVVSVMYRLAPEHPFPAQLDDAVAVYRELLKTHSPAHIAIYGTSAGATLTSEVAVKLKQLGLPQPAALGIFSGKGDFARDGDSAAMYCRAWPGICPPPPPSPTPGATPPIPIRVTPCSRPSMRICTACRPRSFLPARATSPSVAPSTCSVAFLRMASIRAWSSSTDSGTLSGTTSPCRNPAKPIASSLISWRSTSIADCLGSAG